MPPTASPAPPTASVTQPQVRCAEPASSTGGRGGGGELQDGRRALALGDGDFCARLIAAAVALDHVLAGVHEASGREERACDGLAVDDDAHVRERRAFDFDGDEWDARAELLE